MDCYNLNGIIGTLEKEIDREESIVAAWEGVSFPTKKDGKPFAQMGKNISGARYSLESYAIQPGEYELSVTAWSKKQGYVSDTIKTHNLVKYLKNDAMRAKTQNYMPEQSYLERVYRYDLDDIKAAVRDRIERGRATVAALKKSLQRAEGAYKAFSDAYTSALKQLAKDSGKEEESTLYHAILDTVEKHQRYI